MSKPAARIGDMHTCPKITHPGGPVAAGVDTVLIDNMPATVVGDVCTCKVPDPIVKGSFSVLIGGKPAVRMGDMTAHGGIIIEGCPTVLIGGDIAESDSACLSPCAILSQLNKDPTNLLEKQQQAKLLKELDQSVHQNLGNIPESERFNALRDLRDYQKTEDALDMAKLSQAAYDGRCVPGFEEVKGEELKKIAVVDEKYLNHPESGFKAKIYKSRIGGEPEYTIAFAGTDPGLTDWTQANIPQAVGLETEQYDRAIILAGNMEDSRGSNGFRVTGHSLGGGLASAASITTGAQGTTFNASGVHPFTTGRPPYGVSETTRANHSGNVDAYYNSNDPLSKVQDNRLKVLTGIGMLLGTPGKVAVGLLASKGALAKAFGNRIMLPGGGGHGIQDVIDSLNGEKQEYLNKLKKHFGCSG